MSCSSRRTNTARVVAGIGVDARDSGDAPDLTASRISLIWARLVAATVRSAWSTGPRDPAIE
jgi:hypothetical protein